jgi:hypothetical protein
MIVAAPAAPTPSKVRTPPRRRDAPLQHIGHGVDNLAEGLDHGVAGRGRPRAVPSARTRLCRSRGHRRVRPRGFGAVRAVVGITITEFIISTTISEIITTISEIITTIITGPTVAPATTRIIDPGIITTIIIIDTIDTIDPVTARTANPLVITTSSPGLHIGIGAVIVVAVPAAAREDRDEHGRRRARKLRQGTAKARGVRWDLGPVEGAARGEPRAHVDSARIELVGEILEQRKHRARELGVARDPGNIDPGKSGRRRRRRRRRR